MAAAPTATAAAIPYPLAALSAGHATLPRRAGLSTTSAATCDGDGTNTGRTPKYLALSARPRSTIIAASGIPVDDHMRRASERRGSINKPRRVVRFLGCPPRPGRTGRHGRD